MFYKLNDLSNYLQRKKWNLGKDIIRKVQQKSNLLFLQNVSYSHNHTVDALREHDGGEIGS